jgi:hypothetical protein
LALARKARVVLVARPRPRTTPQSFLARRGNNYYNQLKLPTRHPNKQSQLDPKSPVHIVGERSSFASKRALRRFGRSLL